MNFENIGFLILFVKMGIMGEMMNEAVDAAMDNNDVEEETDEEIAKVLNEVLAGK